MTWPAPQFDPLLTPPQTPPEPAPTPRAGSAPAPARPPSELRRLVAAVPPAAWVAVLGGALLLIAAAIVVNSSWGSIGPELRFAAMLVVTAGLTWAAERMRTLVPTTAGVVAHVGAFLAAPVGIAGMSMLGFTWPACLVVGGILAIGTTEVQAGRWRRSTLHVGQIVAISMAATGLAALTDTTAGLIAALVAVGLVAIRAHRRAAGLAVTAVLSPVLWALADAGVGAGTLARAGLVGDRLGWSGPIVGVLAAVVLVIVSRHLRNNGLALLGAAAPMLGLLTGLAALDSPVFAWWCLPAVVLITAEFTWWTLPSDRHRSAISTAIDVVGGTIAGAALASPAVLYAVDWLSSGTAISSAVPAGVTAIALALATARWMRSQGALAELGVAAVFASSVATLIALQSPALLVAAASVFGLAAIVFVGQRSRPLVVYPSAFWGIVAISVFDGLDRASTVIALALLAVVAATVIGARARRAADAVHRHPMLGWSEMATVVTALALAAAGLGDGFGSVAALCAVAAAIAMIVAVERSFTTWSIGVAALGGAIATSSAIETGVVETSGLDPRMWISWVALTAALAGIGALSRSRIAYHAAASAAVVTLAVAGGGIPLDVEQMLAYAIVGVVVLTGLAFTAGRRSPLDSAAITAGVLVALLTGLDVDPLWISAGWFVLGLQAACYGFAVRQPLVQLGGSLVAVVAAGSAWFTSGADEWFMALLEPIDVRGGDLWALAAVGAALAAGAAARKALDVNSWVAYSGGLLIAGLWLASVQLDRDTVWAIPLALTIGIAAAGIGGWRRLAAPLVGGMLLIANTLLLASGKELADLPTWVWLAIGGFALLGVAVLIERASKHGADALRDLAARWH